MLQISKQGNSIVVEGLNHYFYPYNGTLEVPCNSVITVVDEGDIVLFRSASNYDVLFSAKIDEITINGQSVTKDNVGEVFGALSNVSSGGGGGLTPEQEEKLNNAVQVSDYNADKATQTTIDEAQNTEINKLKGDIEGKQDIIQDLNAIREGADLGKTALQEETDPVWTAEKVNYYTKSDIDTSLEAKANKSEIPTVPTNVSAFTNDAGYLTEHQSLDNYYTKTDSDGKYATQVVVNEEIAARINDVREVKATLETKADKSEIPSLNGYATEQWVGAQGYLTEHQPLKTINGETIVGDGNIEIAGGEQISDVLILPQRVNFNYKDGNNYYVDIRDISYNSEGGLDYTIEISENGVLSTKARKIGRISKVGSGGWQTVSYDSSVYGYKIDNLGDNIPYYVYIYSDDDNPIAENRMLFEIENPLVSGTDIKTINGESILGSGDIVISGGGEETDPIWTAEKVNYYTKTEVNTSLESKANKTEIPTVPTNVSAFTNDAGYLTQHQSLKTINGQTIVGDGNIEISGGEETDPIWTAEKGNYYTKTEVDTSLESKANKSEIPTVPTNVSAFTNDAGYLTEHQTLKTINGESILGSGDIVISGGGEETDPVWTAEKVNYYTKTEVNTSLETKADKSEIPSLDNYYTKSEIDGIVGNVNNALSEIING